MAQAFIDTGMEPESVQRFSHILLNSFGCGNECVAAQLHQVPFGAGDRLLLCTDGLTDMVSDDEIADVLRQHAAPQVACDALIERALAHGGRDNVTVVLASADKSA
jgi:PPM family protein phosphatase